MIDPILPYNGSSGWSGSETSRKRAASEDSNGVTSDRQQSLLRLLKSRKEDGGTWKSLGETLGWHHGQISGTLSVLHKAEKIARLTESQNRSAIYVSLDFVNGRELEEYKSKNQNESYYRQVIADEILDWCVSEGHSLFCSCEAVALKVKAGR